VQLDDQFFPQIDLSQTILDRVRPQPYFVREVDYVAPELLRDGLDAQKDDAGRSFMYGLGMLALELASGRPPFYTTADCENAFVLATRVIDQGLTPSVSSTMDGAVARIAKICLNHDPSKRPNPEQLIPVLSKLVEANSH